MQLSPSCRRPTNHYVCVCVCLSLCADWLGAALLPPSLSVRAVHIWAAYRVCLSGAQLGCPGKVAFGLGCTECPKGA